MTAETTDNKAELADSKPDEAPAGALGDNTASADTEVPAKEIGGREGPDPTRFGDWEKNGRCIDF